MSVRNQQQPTRCPLLDPDLGIVSENDHKVGLCLCQFCTCGTHSCPNNRISPYSPMKSKYRRDFEGKPPPKFPKLSPPASPSHSSPKHKLELQTTHKSHFVGFDPVLPPRRFCPVSAKKQLDLVSTSSYRDQYLNWGSVPVNYVKEWYPPPRGSDVRFHATSAYKEAFRQNPAVARTKVEMKSSLPLGSPTMLQTETTYAHTMKAYSGTSATPKPKAAEKYTPVNLRTKFVTTANQMYQPITPTLKDPRQVRLNLLSGS